MPRVIAHSIGFKVLNKKTFCVGCLLACLLIACELLTYMWALTCFLNIHNLEMLFLNISEYIKWKQFFSPFEFFFFFSFFYLDEIFAQKVINPMIGISWE